MEGSNSESVPKPLAPKTYSRRNFLKLLGAGSAALALGATSGVTSTESKEHLTELANMVMIDFAPEMPLTAFTQTQFPDNDAILKRMLGEKYRSLPSLIGEFGFNPLFNQKVFEKEFLEKYPSTALLMGAMNQFQNHGMDVAYSHNLLLKANGFRAKPHILPLQNSFAASSFNTEYKDKLGNQGFSMFVSADNLINMLKPYQDQKVVNLSFQLGEINLTYVENEHYLDQNIFDAEYTDKVESCLSSQDPTTNKTLFFFLPPHSPNTISEYDNQLQRVRVYVRHEDGSKEELTPIIADSFQEASLHLRRHATEKALKVRKTEEPRIDIQGAYEGQHAEKNLLELAKLASAFEDKLFVCAAGNYGDSFRETLDKLRKDNKWPPNILIVGQWNSTFDRPATNAQTILGADIYVDNKALGLFEGSSLSTATISAVASMLQSKGLSIEETKAAVISACKPKQYDFYSNENSINPEELIWYHGDTYLFNPDKFKAVLHQN